MRLLPLDRTSIEAWTEVAFARKWLGDSYTTAGDLERAEDEYRQALAVSPSLSGTTGGAHVKLGDVLLQSGAGTTAKIEQLLTGAKSHVTFNSTAFRLSVSEARVAQAMGDIVRRRHAAAAALDLVALAQRAPQGCVPHGPVASSVGDRPPRRRTTPAPD